MALHRAVMDAALSYGTLLGLHNDIVVIVSRKKCGPQWDSQQHTATQIYGDHGLSIEKSFVGFQSDLFLIPE